MSEILVLADTKQELVNFIKWNALHKHVSKFRYITEEGQVARPLNDAFFLTLSWPRNSERIINRLIAQDVEHLSTDINSWPLTVFE